MADIKLNSIEDAVKDFQEGKFVIVVDDEDRENEGDLIIAAEKIDAEKVNFMLKNARGVLCAPITLSRCDELDLPHQVSDNTSMLGTPFTVTVDKLEGCSTGVSAHDRAETIKALADPNSTPQTFGRPGHINPLYAQDNGVLRRSGHTEAAIDLCKMAGLYPAGALMEIMNEDGTMARLPELMKMAKEWNLKVISTASRKNRSSKWAKRWICQPTTGTSDSSHSASQATDWSTWHSSRANGRKTSQFWFVYTHHVPQATSWAASAATADSSCTSQWKRLRKQARESSSTCSRKAEASD